MSVRHTDIRSKYAFNTLLTDGAMTISSPHAADPGRGNRIEESS